MAEWVSELLFTLEGRNEKVVHLQKWDDWFAAVAVKQERTESKREVEGRWRSAGRCPANDLLWRAFLDDINHHHP